MKQWTCVENPTAEQRQRLEECGKDAQNHPLVLDGTVLRFKPTDVARTLAELVDINQLWKRLNPSLQTNPETRAALRRFYRDMGYSLCGYLDMFGDMLDTEEEEQKCQSPKR